LQSGLSIETIVLTELGRVGRLKRFLAPQLAELIVSQGDEKILESHRREIVVVFWICAATPPSPRRPSPRRCWSSYAKYHGALGPLVAQFEGTRRNSPSNRAFSIAMTRLCGEILQ
jgi:hypothetical protein